MTGTPYASDSDTESGPGAVIAPDRPGFDLRARAVETGVVVASVVVLRLLGVLLLVASSFELYAIDALLTLVAMTLDPNLLVWIAIAAAVQFGLRSMRRPGRWALIVLAAPVAVLLATAFRSLPGLAGAGFGAVLGNGVAWLDAGVLTVVVALAVALSGAFLVRERRRSATIAGALLAVGGMLTLVLAWQFFETYFVLFGSPVVVEPEQESRYVVTAALTLVALVGAVVFAALSRRRGLIVTACVVGCLGLVVAVALPVPADRFIPDPVPAPVERGGGSSCMSPGDPNCIGG